MTLLFWFLVLGVVSIPWLASVTGTPLPYRYRPCSGHHWRTRFPQASAKSIRTFLYCLAKGMGLSSKDAFLFNPDDRVTDIYSAIICRIGVDSYEREDFLEFLSLEFNININELHESWQEDITLSELYEAVAT